MFGRQKIDFFHIRLILALAVLSAAIISYEIQLIHFFTIVQWHHFAFMVISIAMLGFGASGTIISIFRKWLLERKDTLLPFLMISSGLLMTKIGTYYFSDLVGAGVGGILTIFLFWKFTPQEIPSIIAFLPIFAGVVIIRKKARLVLISFTILCLSVVVYQLNRPFDLAPSQFKGVSYAMNLPDAKINHEISSPYGLLQVVSSPVLRYAPGLSLTYTEVVPPFPPGQKRIPLIC